MRCTFNILIKRLFFLSLFVLFICRNSFAHEEKIDLDDIQILAIDKEHSCYHLSTRINALINIAELLIKGNEQDVSVRPKYLEEAHKLSQIYGNYCGK